MPARAGDGGHVGEGYPQVKANWIQSEDRACAQVDPSHILPDRRQMPSRKAAACLWTPYFHDAYALMNGAKSWASVPGAIEWFASLV